MKILQAVLLLCLALSLQPSPGRAQEAVPAPLAAAIAQLDTDLLAIPAGSTVTDAQHQTLVVDLNALAVGIVPAPAPADIDSIAVVLGNAAVAGNVTADSLAELNGDLAADATEADDWNDDIADDAATLLYPHDSDPGPIVIEPFDPGNGDPSLWPIETAVPVFVSTAVQHPRRTRTHRTFNLGVESGQSPSNQFYNGQVEFVTRQVDGSPAQNTIYVRAVGLPQNNPYTLTVTHRSDGAVIPIGHLNVQNVTRQVFNLYLTANIPDDYKAGVENLTLTKAVFGGANLKRTIPADFDAFDVASVTLTDAQGVARLSGQINPTNRYTPTRSVNLHLYGDAAAFAVAKGSLSLVYGNTFNLFAHHLPADTAVTLVADGTAVGEFSTGAKGGLMITQGSYPPIYTRSGARRYPQTLPKGIDLSKVKVLTLTDAQGNVLLSNPVPPAN